MKIEILQNTRMFKRRFNQRFWTRFCIFFQQMLFQRPAIHPNTNRRPCITRGRNHLFDTIRRADIAGVNAQTSRTSGGGFNRSFIMEMNIRDDRHRALFDNLMQSGGAILIRARHTHNISASLRGFVNLVKRARDICGQRVGHRLHRNRRITAHRN